MVLINSTPSSNLKEKLRRHTDILVMLPSHPGSNPKGTGITRKAACFAAAWPLTRHIDTENCGYVVLVAFSQIYSMKSNMEDGYMYSPKDLPLVEKVDVSCNHCLIKDITLLLEEPLCLHNTK